MATVEKSIVDSVDEFGLSITIFDDNNNKLHEGFILKSNVFPKIKKDSFEQKLNNLVGKKLNVVLLQENREKGYYDYCTLDYYNKKY